MRFSKRKLKGLPVPKEIVVKDLASYIRLFTDGKYRDFLFRGEPTNYDETSSSALRGDAIYPFREMQNQFKREVWHKLSSDERTHFTAFSQHHGIPTNLIDVSTSPLVALYFACQNYKNPTGERYDEERGYVYLFEDHFVDITKILAKYEDDNLLELYAHNRNNILLDMYKLFLEFEKKKPYPFYTYLKTLNEDYHYHFGNGFLKNTIPKRFTPYCKGEYKWEIRKYVIDIVNDSEEAKNLLNQIESAYSNISYEVFLYTIYLQRFLKEILDLTEPIWWFNIMPNFKYAPILTFERGRNQQGLFIYQTYLNYVEVVYNAQIVARQRVWPDKIIVVENKKQIYKKLDFIGINEKFIYGDYDNVASYIKKNFT
ncbi:FRG domain-containing protein [Paenibacillus sp. 481]|uniref:FRG domain-containing protein n=1 Tax=Paenibacillus sp. 481 TaxID=2835869 RepID=UPI001E345C71|nr:FRG domain-containing protein [Paenibacillus sp. 481]UHA73759.1 FRG domain-containing protein [Paenibacillus sp. 481]